jgi:transposase-like protein
MTNLTLPIFTDAEKAREHMEAIRWPSGPVCPHCGAEDEATLIKGKTVRPGLYQCNACRQPFSVTVGTVMESSKIPLNKWVLGFHLMASSKKGISAHQLHRMLGVTYKTAWFMAHRIREAMAPAGNVPPLGNTGGFVEADEMYIGKTSETSPVKKRGHADKRAIVALVERGGAVRSFHVEDVRSPTLHAVIASNVSTKAHLRTDEANQYKTIGWNFASHETVKHRDKEYVRGDAHSNTVEGVFSIFRRGMVGTYQHCGEQHLQRYLAEFDFRYSNREKLGNNDAMRAAKAMKASEGKRLTYHKISG